MLMCLFSTSFAFSTFAKPSARSSVAVFASQDTPADLPEFDSEANYLDYMETVSSLPRGFGVGTADGSFVSVEAPNLGKLTIRGTVIQLTEGPTESWAACFTSNKVRVEFLNYFLRSVCYRLRMLRFDSFQVLLYEWEGNA